MQAWFFNFVNLNGFCIYAFFFEFRASERIHDLINLHAKVRVSSKLLIFRHIIIKIIQFDLV